MNVEIITIGNELLIGQVVDTNSAWMGQHLNEEGFDVIRITSIQDTADAITAALSEAVSRVDVVLLTGGLGPTKDDITKDTLAAFFNSKLVFNQHAYDNMISYLKGRVKGINKLNESQAYVPECCEVINNPVGTAPVMWFDADDKIVVSMPGVPSEMKLAMTKEIIPRLQARFKTGHIMHKTIQVYNIPEAVLAEQLESWEATFPNYMTLAYLPSPGKIRLRLTAKTANNEQANKDFERLTGDLYQLVGENIYAEEDSTIEVLLGASLKESSTTLAVAESCTGGNIAHLITKIAGSSAYFKGGVVAYENMVKQKVLGVEEQTLISHGAVSQQVVEQMAIGVKDLLQSDYAIATSGIAGPEGGTDEKPVGTVWVAVAGDFGVLSACYQFGRIRERNIQRASETGMIMLLQQLKKRSPHV
ncbi:competence/damage-inducible protein A [Carboxylicivirga sediminis]|uniref:CinA-like protein n=1 Tax=Carboxylicivirga sediminis TaxID=2006564 RepID=A0A941F5B0_9BACT|nr:competence/damage-inducible protein A [Carboxylicivirga sediminis]MBR8536198.1 competence/damage-inducible protein A [Carboxylicivirga sediminis]